MTSAAPEKPTEVEALPDHRFIDRELSWLAFNQRVLELAEDPELPLLERAKFLAIFSQNLDEYFQVRVAGLKDQVAAGLDAVGSDGQTAAGLPAIRRMPKPWPRAAKVPEPPRAMP